MRNLVFHLFVTVTRFGSPIQICRYFSNMISDEKKAGTYFCKYFNLPRLGSGLQFGAYTGP